MALDAEIRIPDTTLQDNDFKDGEILRGSDVNKIVSVLKAGVNENYKDLKESDTVSNEHILDEVRHITGQERDRWNNTYTKEELYTKEEVYNKSEVYNKNETYPKENLYTKEETYSKNDVYTKDNVYTKSEVDQQINDRISEIGSADMQKAVYDTDNNGVVDNSERLGGQLPSYYASNSELNSFKDNVYIKNETYSKTEVNTIADGIQPDVSEIDNKLGDQVIYELHDTTLNINTKSEGVPTETESVFPNAGAHNSIYRGKFLGNSVTDAQYQALRDGTFTDLFIGDYWTIGGVNYRIASFDYLLNCGDTPTTKHHAVIVPDSVLYNHVMNDTNTTEGGYVGSKMYREGLEQAKTTIKAAFSGHVLSHRIYLTNAVANGKPSDGAWCDSEADLMCEEMVYGGGIFRPTSDGSTVPANYRVEKSQLPLFAHRPDLISNRIIYWLRDVVTAATFALVYNPGNAHFHNASNSYGVRPYFCIYGGN